MRERLLSYPSPRDVAAGQSPGISPSLLKQARLLIIPILIAAGCTPTPQDAPQEDEASVQDSEKSREELKDYLLEVMKLKGERSRHSDGEEYSLSVLDYEGKVFHISAVLQDGEPTEISCPEVDTEDVEGLIKIATLIESFLAQSGEWVIPTGAAEACSGDDNQN